MQSNLQQNRLTKNKSQSCMLPWKCSHQPSALKVKCCASKFCMLQRCYPNPKDHHQCISYFCGNCIYWGCFRCERRDLRKSSFLMFPSLSPFTILWRHRWPFMSSWPMVHHKSHLIISVNLLSDCSMTISFQHLFPLFILVPGT